MPADFDLWLRFFRLTPLCAVGTVLGGFRVHDDRLGEAGDGLYEREAGRGCTRASSPASTADAVACSADPLGPAPQAEAPSPAS